MRGTLGRTLGDFIIAVVFFSLLFCFFGDLQSTCRKIHNKLFIVLNISYHIYSSSSVGVKRMPLLLSRGIIQIHPPRSTRMQKITYIFCFVSSRLVSDLLVSKIWYKATGKTIITHTHIYIVWSKRVCQESM